MNLDKFTERSRGFLQAAQTISMREGHQRVLPDHLLKALMDDDQGLAANLIRRAGGEPARVVEAVKALKGINLNIRPGEKIGIIGRSGSGKSSLAKLIVGLYEADNGSLLVDGVDIRQIDVSELRHNIGYVPQDIQLLAGTLRDNLVSGARYVEDELILQAAELSGVHEFARLHPDGYELQVGERGQNLSGGQRQNVALGRALLLNPQILLLDEPTSAMDNTGEERLKQRLQAVIENKTVLLVTHRASLLSLVDRLIVIDRGQIVADGPKAAVMDALKKGQISVA